MHQQQASHNGTPQLNGEGGRDAAHETTAPQAQNGDLHPPYMDQTNQEIVRLIGQHLKAIGLERSAALLMEESGCPLEHEAAALFRSHALTGEWAKADRDLHALHALPGGAHALRETRFLLLEQKYLEHLEAGRVFDALHVLRNELQPLNHDTARVHRLSALMVCGDQSELRARASWRGGTSSRAQLVARVQCHLPPALMLPPQRLLALLSQAAHFQARECRFHAGPQPEPRLPDPHLPYSLLSDHTCSADSFPTHPIQILNDHCDEVWFCKFSPDGLKLATGSKDTTVMIWDVDPVAMHLTHRRTLDGHSYGVSFLAWSPDGKYLIAAGPEDCPEIWLWNMETEESVVKVQHSQEDSLTAVAWHDSSGNSASGARFVCGGMRGQFYQCAIDGTILYSWEGVRVNALACRRGGSDSRHRVLAADTHHRVRQYDFDDLTDTNLIQEEHPVMALCVNAADTLALINVATQGVHLWDLGSRTLVRRFRGLSQGHFTIHSCFGGAQQDFIASGSEDNKVYIWHTRAEEPISTLPGHTRSVNCVSWNPVYPKILASASDDCTVRIWGPARTSSSRDSPNT